MGIPYSAFGLPLYFLWTAVFLLELFFAILSLFFLTKWLAVEWWNSCWSFLAQVPLPVDLDHVEEREQLQICMLCCSRRDATFK